MKPLRLFSAALLAVLATSIPAFAGAQTASAVNAQQEGYVDANGVLI